jgi:hypothetical protein
LKDELEAQLQVFLFSGGKLIIRASALGFVLPKIRIKIYLSFYRFSPRSGMKSDSWFHRGMVLYRVNSENSRVSADILGTF